jgi:hypothetical protein
LKSSVTIESSLKNLLGNGGTGYAHNTEKDFAPNVKIFVTRDVVSRSFHYSGAGDVSPLAHAEREPEREARSLAAARQEKDGISGKALSNRVIVKKAFE